jgi:hypothetical protein
VLTTTRRREFVDGNHRLAHSISAPTRRGERRAGTCASKRGPSSRPHNHIVSQQIKVMAVDLYRAG